MRKIIRSVFGIALLYFPTILFAGIPVKSVVVFGDSLSDTGNTTHLLKALRRDENPEFLVRPFKIFVIRKMEEFAEDYYVPQMLLDAGIDTVNNFFDDELAPMLANLVGKVRKVPVLPAAPYWNSRFSNGPVWTEYLADMLQLDPKDTAFYNNQAFSGSWAVTWDFHLTVWNMIRHPIDTVKSVIVGKLIPPSLGLSTQGFLMTEGTINNESVYFLFSGANDYLNAFIFDDTREMDVMVQYVDNVIAGLETSIKRLAGYGAKRVVVMGLPDVGLSPKFLDSPDSPLFSEITRLHNERLAQKVEVWRGTWPEMDFLMVEVQPILEQAMVSPHHFGFDNIQNACIDVKLPMFRAFADSPFARNYVLRRAQELQYVPQGASLHFRNYRVCENPGSFLFWDELHPTTRGHHMLAVGVCNAMKAHGYDITCDAPDSV